MFPCRSVSANKSIIVPCAAVQYISTKVKESMVDHMVLKQKETTVTYRCPECGSWVTGMVGLFSLTADMLRLKCPCQGSELDIVYTKDKKVRLTVPCFLCPKPHNFTVSSQMFFEKELFALPCAYSGIDICFMGAPDRIESATKESDKELMDLLGEAGYDGFSKLRGQNEEIFSDPQILEIVNFVIRDLDESGEISCRCPEDEGCYTVEVTSDGVRVTCENCGASSNIPVTSTLSAQAFLNCEHLDLT